MMVLLTGGAFAQNDSTASASPDTTRIHIGSLKILIYDDNSGEDNDQLELKLEDDEDIAPRTPKKEQKVAEKVEVEPEVVAEVVAEAEVTEEENSEEPQTEDDKPSKKAEKEQAEADEELDAFEEAA